MSLEAQKDMAQKAMEAYKASEECRQEKLLFT